MKDEIKELLEKPNVYNFGDECYLYFGDYNKLKDYITNLQEELKDAEKEWSYWEDRCDKAEERLNKLIDNLELKGE